MVDISAYVAAIAQKLSDDPQINFLTDGQIIPGFRRAAADSFLAGTHQACVGVRSLNKNAKSLSGSAYSGIALHDHLFEIRIITLLSSVRQDDSDAYAIAAEVERILRAGFDQELNGVTYHLSVISGLTFTSLDDDQLNDRIEVQATFRLKYIGV